MAKLNKFNDKVYTTCWVCGKEARFFIAQIRSNEPANACYFDELNRPRCGKCINEIAEYRKRTESWVSLNQLF